MSKKQDIRVVVVDDYDAFAISLTRILNKESDIEVVGQAANCLRAVERVNELQPDVVVLDHNLPDGTGVEVAEIIRLSSPNTRILMLSGLTDNETVAGAISVGCSGYVTKDRAVWELVSAVRLVQSGETYLSPDVLAGMMLRMSGGHEGSATALSKQEHDILHLMSTGSTIKSIAKELSLNLRTVRKDIRDALVKLGPANPNGTLSPPLS